MADAAEQRHLVGLEAHPRSTPVAETSPRELSLDLFDRHGESGGEALDDHHQGTPVGLAGCQIAQHRRQIYRRAAGRGLRSPAVSRPRVRRATGGAGGTAAW